MKFIHVLCVTSTLLLAACSSDSDSPAGSGGSTNNNGNNNSDDAGNGAGNDDAGNGSNAGPSAVSEEITAAEGGEVALEDGAGISIPAGALSGDTTITIESAEPTGVPDLDTIQGLTYDFGPDGTTFDAPVELTLPLAGTPGANEEAVISWLDPDTDTWQDVPTTVSGDSVVADIEHFTLFVVRFRGVDASQVTCDFEACTGGNIVGTWNILGACIDFANPFEELCADSTFSADTEFVGTFTFNDDGTYTSTITTGGTLTVNLPPDCLTQLTGGQTVACTELGLFDSDEDGGGTCTGDTATGCDCTGPLDSETKEHTGTYSVDGSTLSTTDEDGTDSSTICITGDTLKAQGTDEADEDGGAPTIFTWSAERQ